ncbi:unnamed protein product [Ilex paraguariensis]|uniref:Uncharacterized protein n=1 Tax=Ilex paraguariensis TaxID=185542 RepID=A0ABC8U7S9_9AQUA
MMYQQQGSMQFPSNWKTIEDERASKNGTRGPLKGKEDGLLGAPRAGTNLGLTKDPIPNVVSNLVPPVDQKISEAAQFGVPILSENQLGQWLEGILIGPFNAKKPESFKTIPSLIRIETQSKLGKTWLKGQDEASVSVLFEGSEEGGQYGDKEGFESIDEAKADKCNESRGIIDNQRDEIERGKQANMGREEEVGFFEDSGMGNDSDESDGEDDSSREDIAEYDDDSDTNFKLVETNFEIGEFFFA